MGGYSSEREISLKSGKAVFGALKEKGASVKAVDIQAHDDAAIREQLRSCAIDVAFICGISCGRGSSDSSEPVVIEGVDCVFSPA